MIERATVPWKHLERAPVVVEVVPAAAGVVTHVDTRRVGLSVVVLGGGRSRPQDPVDHAVGLTMLASRGQRVGVDRPLALVHARTPEAAQAAAAELRIAYTVGRSGRRIDDVVRDRITCAAR